VVGPSGTVLRIPSMDCPTEEAEIRRALTDIAGLRGLRFQLAARTVTVDAPVAQIPEIIAAIRGAGFTPQEIAHGSESDQRPGLFANEMTRYALALALAISAELIAFFAAKTPLTIGIGMLVAVAAIGLAGFATYRKGLVALSQARLNINALMTVAVTGAFLIGQWPEAAMVMALYAIAELIEARAVDRARNSIKGLLDLTPEMAQARTPDGNWQDMLAADVQIDAIVRVRPGARVPLDGVITKGESAIDQASVTGESIPVDKATGDTVFAGTINQTGMLEVRVTAPANDSTIARIIHAVEQAQGTRAPTQKFVDQFASVYTPLVFVVALAVALLTPWLLGWSWMDAIYKALVLLVIACPCALVIATPVSVVSGLAAAARRGILIKGGVYLEQACQLKAIALDKTGTITEGKPKLVATEVLDSTFNEDTLLTWAASLATTSDHPVSFAISRGLNEGGIQPTISVENFTAMPGRGVKGSIENRQLTLANHRWVEEQGLCSEQIESRLREHEKQGRSITMLATNEAVLAIFAVADTIKDSSRQALSDLHALGLRSVMLTGDNQLTAQAIGKQAGIDEVRGGLLPEDKLSAIKALQADHGITGMTGDGINDAPALAQADIGFAMGGAGTDTAMEAADVVIMNDDLGRIADTVRLSQATRSVLWQNIALALGIKAVFLVLALFGNATMWMAVFADMGASLIVVFNGLRLLGTDTRTKHKLTSN
ncbi:MAG: heavy metal translocating P-type ATPase, partial [Burkholderiaceae bacterium]